jgi:very-short-patch-repair endonuclease
VPALASPLPPAGGVGGRPVRNQGTFRERNTVRAQELRNAATPAERLLWQYLSRSQLGVKFSRQMPVGNFFADFLCRELCLVVELDGHSHDVQPERDIFRDQKLKEAGYRVLHFTNVEVHSNVEGVVTEIKRLLADSPTPNPSRKREGST